MQTSRRTSACCSSLHWCLVASQRSQAVRVLLEEGQKETRSISSYSPKIFHCSSCNPTAWIHYSSHAYLKSRVSPTKQHTNTGGGNGVIITQAVKSEAQQTRHVSTQANLCKGGEKWLTQWQPYNYDLQERLTSLRGQGDMDTDCLETQ